MEESRLIPEYVERIASELDFDPSLSRCVRREVEDHLREAVAANPGADRLEAERSAVAGFGDPHDIASQFAVVSIARRSRRAGGAAILAIGAVFVAMQARLTWYALMQRPAAHPATALGGIVGSIDRFAFWLSVVAGIAAWVYVETRRVPPLLTAGYRRQLQLFVLLCSAATGALIASVVSDGVLTSLRLAGTGWSRTFLVPLLSMAVEVACACVLGLQLRAMRRRTGCHG
ncbi:MAG TPA: hypothetical protein VE964_02065 [Myxococcales bacterium]|nr:hypothetical protein [Myxococcales bacterium]